MHLLVSSGTPRKRQHNTDKPEWDEHKHHAPSSATYVLPPFGSSGTNGLSQSSSGFTFCFFPQVFESAIDLAKPIELLYEWLEDA